MAIEAREAAGAAAKYYESVASERVKLSIEEIEMSEDEKYWLITLGISDQYAGFTSMNKPREYKIFKVDANTGEVKSMKIRTV